MARYMCINKCYWKDQIWNVGSVHELEPSDKPPRHFELLERGVAGKLASARKDLDRMGVEYDPTDGIDRLNEKLGIEEEAAEVAAPVDPDPVPEPEIQKQKPSPIRRSAKK